MNINMMKLFKALLRPSCLAIGFCMAIFFNKGILMAQEITQSPDYTLEKLADGMVFCEGPVWHPDGYLLFSDVHGFMIYKWSESGGLETWWDVGKKTNGLILSSDAKTLFACCHSEREMLAINVATREHRVIAKGLDGREFNNVNDVALDAEGNVFFTDPKWGAKPGDPQGIYCVPTSGTVRLAAQIESQPNGSVISPDGQWLYTGRSGSHDIWRFKREPGGLLTGGHKWATLEPDAEPDGMTVDSRGYLYVAQARNSKIAVISPEGKTVKLIPCGQPFPTNCEFQGGSDEKILFVTHGGKKDGPGGALWKITFHAKPQ